MAPIGCPYKPSRKKLVILGLFCVRITGASDSIVTEGLNI